ncbi:IS91 family transposase [Vibrio breoganii]
MMSAFIDVLKHHQNAFEQRYADRLRPEIRRAIHAMLRCKTTHQGQSQWYCQHCHHDDRLPLSCGHRHCPQCQHRTTTDWLERQKRKLLPVHYYMVTFTVPYELRGLAQTDPKALYQTMFKVASGVLKDFAVRAQVGQQGFTSVLHTHNRKRDLHPHLHVVVAAGGYDAAKRTWYKGKKGYLFNAFALAKVWRARLLEALAHDAHLHLPTGTPAQWVVDCRKVGYGLPALKYLSRYLYRGVLPDKDTLEISETAVTFRYQDSQTQCTETRSLPVLEFLWLILQHVLPKGLQRVRDYGFMHGNARRLRLAILLLLAPQWIGPMPTSLPVHSKAVRTCPCCEHEMVCVGITRPS